ncbi:cyclase [Verrucosispora sp. WMMC514]|uniref:SRPBCC family protein n=1 Tax=Verrucosispora sp. WMMC514 TaxID=3015156 RepID=UPI00248D2C23|nr:cyclase [Verrucosispora sp. WMMC514]WBB92228.1 cyclase [Verrucosispora sp. WMMC514]
MRGNATRLALVGAATVTAVGVGRAVTRRRRRHRPHREDGWYVVRRAVTVDRPVAAVIGFWTERQRLDRALAEWAALEQIDGNRWRCVSRDPDTGDTEWRAEITVTGPGRLRWQVTGGPEQQGTVELVPAPQGRGTEIRAELRYRSGPLRRALGLAAGDEPDLRLRDTLRRVKSLIECGQLIDTRRDPSGRSRAQRRSTDEIRQRLTTGGRA